MSVQEARTKVGVAQGPPGTGRMGCRLSQEGVGEQESGGRVTVVAGCRGAERGVK